jgi:hypothetical protein
MTWKCTTCDREFDSIPEDAVLLSRGKFNRVIVYRFADGVVHGVRKIKPVSTEHLHRRWHKTPTLGCEFCFPSHEPEPPVERTELLQAVVEVLTELPEPQPEIKSEPEIEIEDESSMTSMQIAFRRRREIQN